METAVERFREELENQADGSATIISMMKGQVGPVAASLVGMLSFQEQCARAALADYPTNHPEHCGGMETSAESGEPGDK